MNCITDRTQDHSPARMQNRTLDRPHAATSDRTHTVLVHGLEFFCERLPGAFQTAGWDIRHHSVHRLASIFRLLGDLRRADLIFIWGGRISMGKVLRAARFFDKRKIVLLWSGSDVLGAQFQFAEGKLNPWIAGQTHWAGAPWLADEIRAIGLKCEYVPVTWVSIVEKPRPLPKNFSVLVYLPSVRRAKLYGLDRILQVSRSLPHISFELVGLVDGQIPDPPPNLHISARIRDMAEVYRRSTVYWRPVQHDGLCFMSLEALSHGRHVIWSYPFPHCYQSSNAEEDRAHIERLHASHCSGSLLVNDSGIDVVSKNFSLESIKREYLRRWTEIILSSAESG